MATLFDVSMVVGGIVLCLMLLASVLGFDGDADVEADFDADGDISPGEGLNLFSIRALAAGLAFFGLCGGAALNAGAGAFAALAVGSVAGLGAMYVVALVVRFMRGMEEDGTPRIENAVGKTARVYTNIPAMRSGAGKVTVVVQGRSMEYRAETAGEALLTGTTVRVVALLGADTLEVASSNDA